MGAHGPLCATGSGMCVASCERRSGCLPLILPTICPKPEDGEFACDGRRIHQTCKEGHNLCDMGYVHTYLPCVSESACNAAMAVVEEGKESTVGRESATCAKRGWFSDTWYLYHSQIGIGGCGWKNSGGWNNASYVCGLITDRMDNATWTCFGEAGGVIEATAVFEAMI